MARTENHEMRNTHFRREICEKTEKVENRNAT